MVHLAQQAPAVLFVQAYSMARDVSGSKDSGYAVYIDIGFIDGTHEWGFHLPFSTGTHKWEKVEARIDRDKPISYIEVRG